MEENHIDAIAYLNRLLSQAPPIEYTKHTTTTVKECHYEPHPGDGHGTIKVCKNVVKTIHGAESGQPTVESSEIVRVLGLKMHEEQIVQLPENIRISRQTYQNCDDVHLSTTLALSVTGTKGFTVSKGKTVTTTKGVSVSLGYSGIYGSYSTAFNLSTAVSLSNSVSESESESVTRALSVAISVPPRTAGKAELVAYETTIEIPFSAKVIIDGTLRSNLSGVTKASDFLDEEARTVPFSGTLIVRDVSESRIRTEKLPHDCADHKEAVFVESEIQEFSVPASDFSDSRFSTFLTPEKALNEDPSTTELRSRDGNPLDDTIIGQPDGIFYSILYTRPVSRPHLACGFNDLGIPNLGNFSVEGREYVHYVNKEVIRRWFEEHEVFVSCWTP